jgi:hypothetical protein
MHRSATKCNETIGKWYKNKHGASKIIDTFETYQQVFTFSSSRHRAETLYHGLLSLRMLFVGIGQSFFSFLRLSQR